MISNKYTSIASVAIVLFVSNGVCEEIDFGNKTPTVDEVIEALKGDKPTLHRDEKPNQYEVEIDKKRGIQFKSAVSKKSKVIVRNAKQPSSENALSIELLFDYDSADLRTEAITKLEPIGKALASQELDRLSFVVEGHTDSIGSSQYNYNLSMRRARSVKRFLVAKFHIDPSRLDIVGKGESALLDPANPTSGVNRRVRIVAK